MEQAHAARKKSSAESIKRHTPATVTLHWVVAVSSFVLIVSGLGQIPLARLLGFDILDAAYPGLYYFHLRIHYIFAAMLTGATVFHILYHLVLTGCDILPGKMDFRWLLKKIGLLTGENSLRHYKYYPSQKYSYLLTGSCLLGLVLTGMIKVLENAAAVQMPAQVVFSSTYLHLLFTALLLFSIIAHIVAVHLFKKHRGLIPGIISGWISREYAREHFQEWVVEAEQEN